jgi:hypothetical protein
LFAIPPAFDDHRRLRHHLIRQRLKGGGKLSAVVNKDASFILIERFPDGLGCRG